MDVKRFESELWYMFKLIKDGVAIFFNSFLEEQGLTKAQAGILFGLKNGDFCTIGNMTEHIISNQGNASTICKKMEQQGLIKRTRSTRDERVVILTLTEEGDKKVTELHNSILNRFEKVSKHIEPEQFDKIISGFAEFDSLLKAVGKYDKK